MWRILTTVSAEPDQEGDSRDAMENRNGYFMIRGDYVDTNTNKKRSKALADLFFFRNQEPVCVEPLAPQAVSLNLHRSRMRCPRRTARAPLGMIAHGERSILPNHAFSGSESCALREC
jgi:hypothetical protein